MQTNNFVFFPSFLECVENAPENDRAEIVYCIVQYGIYGKISKSAPQSFKMIFPAIRPIIDASIKRYNAQKENGKKGGRPKKEKLNQNPSITQLKPKDNPTITHEKPNQNLNKEKDKEKNKNIKEEYQQQQKEINKEKVDDVVDVDFEKKNFYLDCLKDKLNKFSNVLNVELVCKIEKLVLDVFNSNSFIIANEKISSADVLCNFVNLFVGTEEEVITRFNKLFSAIDNAENVSNRLKYSVSVLYQCSCNNC